MGGNTSDVRALESPDSHSREAATYDPNEFRVAVTFEFAFSGNLHLYAVDWDQRAPGDDLGRQPDREPIERFQPGRVGHLPIRSRERHVTITVDQTPAPTRCSPGSSSAAAEPPPPFAPPHLRRSAPQGNWVGTYGARVTTWGVGMAGDVVSMPGVSEWRRGAGMCGRRTRPM